MSREKISSFGVVDTYGANKSSGCFHRCTVIPVRAPQTHEIAPTLHTVDMLWLWPRGRGCSTLSSTGISAVDYLVVGISHDSSVLSLFLKFITPWTECGGWSHEQKYILHRV